MKIVFAARNNKEKKLAVEKMKRAGIATEVIYVKSPLSDANSKQVRSAEIIAVFVDTCLSAAVINKLPNLKFIAARSTGFDHIDLEVCKKRKIIVSNVPNYGEHTVAEYTFALILELSRGVMRSSSHLRKDGVFNPDGIEGFDLIDKTLGVVGTGRIGKNVVKIAKGFGMKVAVCDVCPDEKFAQEIHCSYSDFKTVLKTSDLVTLHVPYSKETRYLINSKTIKIMKRGGYLINTSRGGIVETKALVMALKAKHLAGAALDVLEEEDAMKNEFDFAVRNSLKGDALKTMLQNRTLINMPNVIVAPHNAFNTREANHRILDTTVQNIKAYLSGRPINTVTG